MYPTALVGLTAATYLNRAGCAKRDVRAQLAVATWCPAGVSDLTL